MPSNEQLSRAALVSLIGALGVGAFLRLVGAGYGLPAVYNPDEVAIMNRAIGLSQNHLNPGNFLYPSLYFYALFVWEGLWFLLGRATGIFASMADFEYAFFTNPTSIYVAGRVLTAICGVLTIWATWRLGERLFNRTAGIMAAALLAVSPLAVRDAHYVKHDVPVTWLIVLAHALMAAEMARSPEKRRWWWPAIVSGLAMSTHYYAVFLAIPLALLILLPDSPGGSRRQRWRQLVRVGAIVAATFLVTSPFLLLEPGTAIRDVLANRQIVVDRAVAHVGAFGSLGAYLSWLVEADGLGWGLTGVAAAGVIAAWRRGPAARIVTLAFPLTFLLFLANTVPASRYLNPLAPFACMLAGAVAAELGRSGGRNLKLAALLVGLPIVLGLATSLRVDMFFRQVDTRTEALQWIQGRVPPNTSILVQPYSVPVRQSREALHEALTLHLGSADRASVKYQRLLTIDPVPSPAYRPIFLGAGGMDVDKIYVAPAEITAASGFTALRRLSVTHVVMKRYNVADPAMAALDAALHREGRLVATFSPYRPNRDAAEIAETPPFLHNGDAHVVRALERPGPIIEIWTID